MKTKFRQPKQKKLILLVALVLVVAAAGTLAYRQMAKSSNQQHSAVTPQPSGKTSTGQDTTAHSGPSHDVTPAPTVVPSNPSHPRTSTLAKPTGQILSNNSVSLGSGVTTIDSTCVSLTGASCYIQATMGSQVKKVSETKTISDGAQGVELLWDANQLSAGSWNVQAVASLNGQTASSDAYTLTVTK